MFVKTYDYVCSCGKQFASTHPQPGMCWNCREGNVITFDHPHVPNSPEWGNQPGQRRDGDTMVQCTACNLFWTSSRLSNAQMCAPCEEQHEKDLNENF